MYEVPAHFPIGVDEEGHGPVEIGHEHHFVCWCGLGRECVWNIALDFNGGTR